MRRVSILIVDDDEATCVVLALALKSEGYQCRMARNCAEARASLERGPLPDLILLDLLLPDACGTQFLERLAGEPAWANIPVIIMSAWGKADEVARQNCRELLAKPFSLSHMEEAVRRHIGAGIEGRISP